MPRFELFTFPRGCISPKDVFYCFYEIRNINTIYDPFSKIVEIELEI